MNTIRKNLLAGPMPRISFDLCVKVSSEVKLDGLHYRGVDLMVHIYSVDIARLLGISWRSDMIDDPAKHWRVEYAGVF